MRAPTRDDALHRGLLYFLLIGGTRPSSSGLCVERRVPATRLEQGLDAMCELGQVADLFGHLGAAHLRQWSQLPPGLGRLLLALGPLKGEALLWAVRPVFSTSGPKGPRRRLRRRVPVNPGRRAGDAAREAAARRAVGRVAADLPPRLPPEAACWAPAAATRRCRRARAPSPCRRHERRRAASVRRGRGRGELRQQRERQRGAADRRGEVRLRGEAGEAGGAAPPRHGRHEERLRRR